MSEKCGTGGKLEEGKRAGIVSKSQKDMLVEFVKQNPQLNNPKFSNKVTKAAVEKLWDHVTSILNAVPNGAVKTKVQWKRTWQDQKKVIKGKLAANKKNFNKTGGGPSEHVEMSPDEEQQLTAIVPKISVNGNQEIKESDVLFEDDNDETKRSGELDGFEDFLEEYKGVDVTILDEQFGCGDNLNTKNIDPENFSSLFPPVPDDFMAVKVTDLETEKSIPDDSNNNWKMGMKTEFSSFPSKKRSMAVHRQDASLRNSENIIAISAEELKAKKRYYEQKTFLLAKEARAKYVESRVLRTLNNRLVYNPW